MRDLVTLAILMVVGLLLILAGATAHERDMYNNLKIHGDAKAWTCKIVSAEMKGKP